jgi:hypothetical protein
MHGMRGSGGKHRIPLQWNDEGQTHLDIPPDGEADVFQPVTDGAAHKEAAMACAHVLSFVSETFQVEGRPLPKPSVFVGGTNCEMSLTMARSHLINETRRKLLALVATNVLMCPASLSLSRCSSERRAQAAHGTQA